MGIHKCPPIVPKELWEQVEAALVNDAPPSNRSPDPSSHPLTGVLFCGCGGRMNVASSRLKFTCRHCGDRIPVSDLEERFLDEVTSFLRARRELAAEILTANRPLAEQRKLLREAEEALQRLNEEIAKTERLYMESHISAERFGKLHQPLEDQRRASQRDLGKIKAKLARLEAKGAADGPQPPPFDPDELRKRWPFLSTIF